MGRRAAGPGHAAVKDPVQSSPSGGRSRPTATTAKVLATASRAPECPTESSAKVLATSSRAARHWAEELARAALERRGWTTVAANARVPGGELDLVMHDGRVLVFVEVRQRRGAAQGGAAESLVARKRARVRRAAALWLTRHGGDDRPVRFDAVLVDGDRHAPRLRHVRDAF